MFRTLYRNLVMFDKRRDDCSCSQKKRNMWLDLATTEICTVKFGWKRREVAGSGKRSYTVSAFNNSDKNFL